MEAAIEGEVASEVIAVVEVVVIEAEVDQEVGKPKDLEETVNLY